MQIIIFSFRKYERSAKKPLTCAISYDMVVENFVLKTLSLER
jgi:hypothetical protein